MNIVFKSGDYVSVPMTENLFWNRVGNLRQRYAHGGKF